MQRELMIKIALILAALLAGTGIPYILRWKNDNIIEEVAEEYIKYETGFDIDLTPNSPEVHEFNDEEEQEIREYFDSLNEWAILEKELEDKKG